MELCHASVPFFGIHKKTQKNPGGREKKPPPQTPF